jgi:hypothetical protein
MDCTEIWIMEVPQSGHRLAGPWLRSDQRTESFARCKKNSGACQALVRVRSTCKKWRSRFLSLRSEAIGSIPRHYPTSDPSSAQARSSRVAENLQLGQSCVTRRDLGQLDDHPKGAIVLDSWSGATTNVHGTTSLRHQTRAPPPVSPRTQCAYSPN